jgi:hypothetical protein
VVGAVEAVRMHQETTNTPRPLIPFDLASELIRTARERRESARQLCLEARRACEESWELSQRLR